MEEVILEQSVDTVAIVEKYYDNDPTIEWGRIGTRPEFLLTCRMMDKHIKSGDKVLDIGGGPGVYTMHLAKKGCDVTLFDLSKENINFAKSKAKEQGLAIEAIAGDARIVDEIVDGQFDHVLLMGPLYHLLEESDRIKAVLSANKLLKPSGKIYVSFIAGFAGIIYCMKFAPELINDPNEADFIQAIVDGKSYGGAAFTQAYFIHQNEVLPFMAQFPFEKLHFFGQEGITSPCEGNIMSQSEEVVAEWLDFAEKLCEREELLSWSEHLMYIGRKV